MNGSSRNSTRNTILPNVETLTRRHESHHENTFALLDLDIANTTVETPGQDRSCLTTVFIALILAVIVILTVIGNVLVIASIVVNANLRTTTYYFIANLAIADLLLSTTVLPFSAALEVLQYWVFGQLFCDVWAAIDVLCCTASILSLCVISIDRYIGVTRPLHHGRIMSQTRTIYVIIFVWLLSVAISVAPLIGWKEDPNPDPRVCTVTTQPGYVLFSVAGSFYIPCLIILVVYFRIYREAVIYTRCLMSGGKMSKSDQQNIVSLRIHMGRNMIANHQQERCQVLARAGLTEDCNSNPSQYSSKKIGKISNRRTFMNKVAKFKREKKAAKTLGIVVGVFIICWLPFFIILPLDSLCTDCSVPSVLFKLFFWLGYCNSTVNPVIYTCSSIEFRRAFLGILCCRQCSKRPRVSLTELQIRARAHNAVHRRAVRQKRHSELQHSCEMMRPPSTSTPGMHSMNRNNPLRHTSVSVGNPGSDGLSLGLTDCPNNTVINACFHDKHDHHYHNGLSHLPSKFENLTQTLNDENAIHYQQNLPVKSVCKDQGKSNDKFPGRRRLCNKNVSAMSSIPACDAADNK